MASLTDRQRERLRLAIQGARGDSLQWTESGPLAQLALLEGHRPTDLARWDESTDEDGRITVRRLVESGNAFVDWPLDVLEAIEREWGRKPDREALMGIVERGTTAHAAPATEDEEMTYEGPERRASLSLNFELKSIIAVVAFVALVMPGLVFLLQMHVGLRQNTTDDMRRDANTSAQLAAQKLEIEALKVTAAKFERAHALYCSGLRRDSAQSPDADC